MERKLVRQGRNALTITLPAAWTRGAKLRAGDTIVVETLDKDLLIKASKRTYASEAILDARGMERSMLFHLILGAYIEGADRITVLHDPLAPVQEILSSLMGMIIDEHTATKTIFRSIVAVPEDTFQSVFRRALHILAEQARTLRAVSRGKATFKDVKTNEKMLDYNLLYCLRYLNKYEHSVQSYRYFLLCSTLESAGDHLSLLAPHIGKDRMVGEHVAELMEGYTAAVAKHDLGRVYSMLRQAKKTFPRKTFADGLVLGLVETLYNYIGFLVEKKTDQLPPILLK